MAPKYERREFARRDFIAGALATGVVSAVATYLTPGGRATAPVEIRFVTGTDETGARDLLVQMWNRANPRATVDVDLVQGSTADQSKAMLDKVASGAADVLNLDVIDIPTFHEQKLISPVEIEDVNGFLPSCLLTSTLGDLDPPVRWAVPFNADVGMLFRRLPSPVEATNQPPPPQLPDVVDRLVSDGSQGFVGQLRPTSISTHEAFVVNVLEHALCRDPEILDRVDGTPALSLDRWREALDPLRAAVAANRIARVDTELAARDDFSAGEPPPPYMRNWPVKYRELQQEGDVDARASRIGVSELPVGILGGQSLAVASTGRNADRAQDFIRFMTSLEAQKILASYGLPPTRAGAYDEPSVQAFIPHLKLVQGAVEKARPRPVSPKYGRFTAALVPHFEALLNLGRDLPEQFVVDVRTALDIE